MNGRIAIPFHGAGGTLIGYAGRIVDEEAIGKDTPRYLGSQDRNGTRHQFHKSAFLYNGFQARSGLRLWSLRASPRPLVAHPGGDHECGRAHARLPRKRRPGLLRDLVPEDGAICLLPDGDKAGERMAEETLLLLAPYPFMRLVKLDEGQQPTDMSSDELLLLLGV